MIDNPCALLSFLEAAEVATLPSQGNLPWYFGVGEELHWAVLWNSSSNAVECGGVLLYYPVRTSTRIGGLKKLSIAQPRGSYHVCFCLAHSDSRSCPGVRFFILHVL